jgi:3-hydroxyisobutyrate dehydrogenase-like beta-hydroxyacid dehydrogenase
MGSALARTLLQSGRSVTVWNRTAQRAAPLVALGAAQAESPSHAIAASPVTIVCVGNYADTHAVLDGARAALTGKTLVQLTTGTGAQANRLAEWTRAQGADYLDGVIMAYPSGIGDPRSILLVAGDAPAWRRWEDVLRTLGGGVRYLGENLHLPAALDGALVAPMLGMVLGMMQGALLCEKESFPVATYIEWMTEGFPVATHQVQHLAQTIARNRFGDTEAALKTYAAAISTFADDYRSRGINVEFIDWMSELLARAMKAGYGDEELSAVIKVLR